MGLKTWGIKAAKALRSDAGALIGERQHRETIESLRSAARQIFTPAPRSQWSKLSDPPNRAAFAAKYHAVGLTEADAPRSGHCRARTSNLGRSRRPRPRTRRRRPT
ncbi:hypothetical protein ACR42A_12620 [Burkholderia gladioli]|uniref:hypothetical protein n=1 Tax=Burkholderia gladioli TaxID=28095 RepID=UPI001641FF8B|nr:hypothetical protein [Burkholderia gladioli]